MVDLTTLTDAQLQALYARPPKALSDAELKAAWERANAPVTADVAKGFGVGAGEGAIGVAGLPGDAAVLLGQGLAKAAPALSAEQKAALTAGGALAPLPGAAPPAGGKVPPAAPITTPFTSADIRRRVEEYTGPFYEPQTPQGRMARTAGQMLPAMAIGGPEGLASRLVTRVVAPTLSSEAAQRVAAGTPYEPYAGPAGAMVGALSPRAAGRLITPLPADPRLTAMARALEAPVAQGGEGVPVFAGQATGRPWLQGYEGKPPGQAEAYTSGALRRMGLAGGPALPDVVRPEVQAMGREYNALAARNNMRWDVPLSDQVVNIAKRYGTQMPAEQKANFQRHVSDIYQTYGDVVPGPVYQEKVSALGAEARRIGQSDPTTAAALRELQGALKGAMDRSIAQYNPADIGAWRDLDRRWAAFKTLEPEMTIKSQGVLTPDALAAAVEKRNRGRSVMDTSDLAEYARKGQILNTSERNPILGHANIPTILGALAGAGLGHAAGDATGVGILGSIIGTPVGAAGVQAARPLVTSAPMQWWLKNQGLALWLNDLDPKSQTALVSAILARPSGTRAPAQ